MLKMQATLLLFSQCFLIYQEQSCQLSQLLNALNSSNKKIKTNNKKKGLNQINNKSNSAVLNCHLESLSPELVVNRCSDSLAATGKFLSKSSKVSNSYSAPRLLASLPLKFLDNDGMTSISYVNPKATCLNFCKFANFSLY